MSQSSGQSVNQRINTVDVPVEEGKEGWREYKVTDMWSEIEKVVQYCKTPEMENLKRTAKGVFISNVVEKFEHHPLFKHRLSLLKMVANGLDAQAAVNLGEMLATIEMMQNAPNSKVARGIEFDQMTVGFNRRNAPHLLNNVSNEQLSSLRSDFVNRTGDHAPSAQNNRAAQ